MHARELLGAAKASLRLVLGTSLYAPRAYSPPSLLIGSSLSLLKATAYPHYHIVLFHRLSYNLYLAYLLPTVHLGKCAL